jgi:uncharacterized protein (TIGR03437 family)
MMVCGLKAQYNDAGHVSACVHYGICDMSRIAQGSIFDAYGQTQGTPPGPAASAFPLRPSLGGVSVQVTVGDRTLDAWILEVKPALVSYPGASGSFSVRAVLPSGTLLGVANVAVLYKGAALNAAYGSKMLVVAHDLGLYSASDGGYTAQNVSSSGSVRLNDFANSATPGQLVVLWGTGLGAVSADEAAGPAPGDLGIQGLQVLVANKPARVVYAGRSGCCAGVDQIIFEVPPGVQGCGVPVVVQFLDDGSQSNGTSLSIAAQPGACPIGLSADLTQKYLAGSLVSAVLRGSVYDGNSQSLDASFTVGILPWELPSPTMPNGGCYGTAGLAGANENVTFQGPWNRPLDAGRQIVLRTPEGMVMLRPSGSTTAPASQFIPLHYSADTPTDHLIAGDYALDNSDGGPDIQSFQSTFSLPDLSFVWTNKDTLSTVAASQDLTITWKAASPDGFVYIGGGYARSPGLAPEDDLESSFVCVESADKGIFTIPGSILWRAKGSSVPDLVLQLSVSNTVVRPFMAPTLDLGNFSWTTGFTKRLKFQ